MTAYYYQTQRYPCKCCERPFEQMHFATLLPGMAAMVSLYPSLSINSLEDWIGEFMKHLPTLVICNEFGEEISPLELMSQIYKRTFVRGERPPSSDLESGMYIKSDQYCDFYLGGTLHV